MALIKRTLFSSHGLPDAWNPAFLFLYHFPYFFFPILLYIWLLYWWFQSLNLNWLKSTVFLVEILKSCVCGGVLIPYLHLCFLHGASTCVWTHTDYLPLNVNKSHRTSVYVCFCRLLARVCMFLCSAFREACARIMFYKMSHRVCNGFL